MIHTDKYYANPVVYRMVTCGPDRYITLDTTFDAKHHAGEWLPGTYLIPVSYVSNDAPPYFNK
jgi:hypothetical protein